MREHSPTRLIATISQRGSAERGCPATRRCSPSSISAASGRATRCVRTAPLARSGSLPPALPLVVRSGRLRRLDEDDRIGPTQNQLSTRTGVVAEAEVERLELV